MKTRTITSAFILLVTVPLIIFSQYIIYPIALAVLSLFATYEILRAIGVEREYILSVPAYILSCALPFGSFFVTNEKSSIYLLTIAALMFFYLIYIMGVSVFSKGRISYKTIAEVFMSITYVVVSFSALSIIRYINREVGVFWLALVFIVSWVSDSMAYVVGSLIGKHKLIPEISPKKTVEGAIGGVVGAIIAFLLYGLILDLAIEEMEVRYFVLAIYAAILAVVSQLGDLIASLIKREHGVKDYSNLLPGHGGIMDRFDSILAVSTILLILCLVVPPIIIV
ncbi:MAG: phosphatidate cytidylyltransferase [Clostridia bacterium]|nr:phosphatidate cytidylyltransferase [Clostridia bacterium]MBP3583340.1 phosphatidate cytidylyltransferase [Clostridia bacterium]